MKRFVLVITLVLCSTTIFAQKTRFAKQPPKTEAPILFPLKVHISGVHTHVICVLNGCEVGEVIYADAVIDGNKIDLAGKYMDLTTGDYPARFSKKKSDADPLKFGQKIELALPDGSTWKCIVAGFSE